MKRLVLLVAVLGFACLFTGTAFADILNVPAEYSTIQAGIDAASPGDTVQVAASTYYENITMKSGVVIQGAGQGLSIIDGGESGSVVTANGVNSAAKLDGFTITKDKAIQGGGMYSLNSSPTVSNCSFLNNSASIVIGAGGGGGMYNESSSPSVTNCTFSGNDASGAYGGGMYNVSSSPTVTDCTFSGNTSYLHGGGMANDNSSPTVSNCTFSGNDAGGLGGGMFNNSNSSPTVSKCSFSNNEAGDGGGGMCNFQSSPAVVNCLFYNNGITRSETERYGRQMANYVSSSPTLTNCTFFLNNNNFYTIYNDNSSPIVTNCIMGGPPGLDVIYSVGDSSPVVTYSDILLYYGGSLYPGAGNISADPKFVNAAQGDFHLRQGSPCIDTGTSNGAPDKDLEGNPRPQGDGYDMGAYEFQLAKTTAMPWIMLLLGD